MAVHFHRASPFEENRLRIEDFIFRSIVALQSDVEAAIRGVEKFAAAIDSFVDTLEQMYQTPNPKDVSSERSSPALLCPTKISGGDRHEAARLGAMDL